MKVCFSIKGNVGTSRTTEREGIYNSYWIKTCQAPNFNKTEETKFVNFARLYVQSVEICIGRIIYRTTFSSTQTLYNIFNLNFTGSLQPTRLHHIWSGIFTLLPEWQATPFDRWFINTNNWFGKWKLFPKTNRTTVSCCNILDSKPYCWLFWNWKQRKCSFMKNTCFPF